jgi:carboxypeptidase family protein
MPERGAMVFLLIQCALFHALAEPAVPQWFEYDPLRPLAIFSAWKHLTTPRATVCLGEGWTAVGGVLCDHNGNPLSRTPLGITVGQRWPSADLVTDDHGHFIFYGVSPGLLVQPSKEELKKLSFVERLRYLDAPTSHAAPGYPASYDGWLFAQSKNELRECDARILLRRDDRAFYVLNVNATNSFDQNEFARFKAAQYAAIETPYPVIKAEFTPHETLGSGPKLRIRLLTWRGKSIRNALVKTWVPAAEGKTDARGYCELPYTALEARDEDMWKTMESYLYIDAPGYADGPVQCELRTNRLNVIKLKAPANVSGKIVDSEGAPYPVGEAVLVQYTASEYPYINLVRFTRQHANRSFSFDGIMPGVSFRLYANDQLRSVWTEDSMLKPGEHRNGIVLRLPWPGAILGRVLDEGGKAVERADVRVRYDGAYYEDSRSIWGGADGQFAFRGLSDKPLRIEVEAEGFLRSLSDQMTIQPGELRLIEVRLHKDKAAEFVQLE